MAGVCMCMHGDSSAAQLCQCIIGLSRTACILSLRRCLARVAWVMDIARLSVQCPACLAMARPGTMDLYISTTKSHVIYRPMTRVTRPSAHQRVVDGRKPLSPFETSALQYGVKTQGGIMTRYPWKQNMLLLVLSCNRNMHKILLPWHPCSCVRPLPKASLQQPAAHAPHVIRSGSARTSKGIGQKVCNQAASIT